MSVIALTQHADEKHTAGAQYQQQYVNGNQQPSPIEQQSPGGFAQPFQPSPSHVQQRTSSNDRVPLPPQHSRNYSGASSPGSQQVNGGGGEQAMVVQASGPMSSGVVVPQRPRPGRKPIPQEDAADRRRLQNRIAQRNFRDKRQQKLQEALAELEEKKQAYQNEISNLRRTLENSRQDLLAQLEKANQSAASFERRLNESEARTKFLEQQNEELRKREELRNQQSQASIASFRPHLKLPEPTPTASHHSSVHTPPEDISPTTTNYNELETDYTSRFASSNLNLRPTASNDHMDFSYTQPSEDPCGFCTDTSNCLCAATKQQQQREQQHDQQIEQQMKHTEAANAAGPTNGPGSCDMCRQDPERAKACRDLANSASMGTRPPTGHGPRTASFAETNVKTTTSMPPPPMSCTAMIDAFNKYGERTSSISTLFGGRLNAYPARTGGGYEIEEKQAAEVLATLSRRSTQSDSGVPAGSPRHDSTATNN